MCRDASGLLLSLLLLFVYHPYFFDLFGCFLYLFVFIFNNIAAECGVHGQSLVSSFWHEAMHKHGQVSFRVVYPISSRAFVLHSLLHKRELSATMRTRGSADKLFIALYVDLGCLDG